MHLAKRILAQLILLLIMTDAYAIQPTSYIDQIVSSPIPANAVISPSGLYVAYLQVTPSIDFIHKQGKYHTNHIIIVDQHGQNKHLDTIDDVIKITWDQDDQHFFYIGKNRAYFTVYRVSLPDQKQEILRHLPGRPTQITIVNHQLFYTLKEDKHVFLINLDQKKSHPIALGPTHDHIESFAVAPQSGRKIAIIVSDSDERKPSGTQLRILDLDSPAKTALVTKSHAYFAQVMFSDDDRQLIYTSNEWLLKDMAAYAINQYENLTICVEDLTKKSTHCIQTFDNTPKLQCVLPHRVLFEEAHTGKRVLYTLDLTHFHITAYQRAHDSIRFTSCAPHSNEVAFTEFDLKKLPQIARAKLTDNQSFHEQIVSDLADKTDYSQIATLHMHWKNHSGIWLQGYLIYPKTTQTTKKIPLIIALHGGPNHDWTNYSIAKPYTLDTPFSAAALVHQGYAVFMPNPQGSWGRGMAFTRSIYQNWCQKPYDDVMDGLEYIFQNQEHWHLAIDIDRLGIWGWSYGGYLVGCAISQKHPRYPFQAAVAGASATNLLTLYPHDPHFLTAYFGASMNNRDLYQSESPSTHFQYINTPILFEAGAEDDEVPIEQSIMLYQRLEKLGKPSELILYPHQGHTFDDPYQLDQAMTDTERFFQKYLG